ncbi:MAG: efflux RND transporter permease subunit [Gemmataceae bacterium]
MYNFFYRNSRLTALAISLILVAGLSSFYVLPRMEDPQLTPRVAIVNTVYPGAEATRVESLVTEKIEEELREVEEIQELRSFSRTGISTITIELRDDVYEVGPVWARIRDKIDDAVPKLPEEALDPDFEEQDMKAYALIVSLEWIQDDKPNYAIVRRLAEVLEDEIRSVPGTEKVETYGDPTEEIVVEIDQSKLAGMNITAAQVSDQVKWSDAKVNAGTVRGTRYNLLLEVKGRLDSLDRIERIPIRYGGKNQFVLLGDIATVRKEIKDPPDSLAITNGKTAVALGVLVRGKERIDHWNARTREVLNTFRDRLPEGVRLSVVFEQNSYVQNRLQDLLWNLLVGALAVIGVIFVLMGWRSALIVGTALPLSALMVLSGLRFLEIPIHQMSVTGLIIALGLLIDNAIVVVDEITVKLRQGIKPGDAVANSVQHLAVPLFGSTLTTALAFAPIALMPGPAGEFVGSIATSVILAIFSSLLVAMTIVAALTAWMGRVYQEGERTRWWTDGISDPTVTNGYRSSLRFLFRTPILGVLLGITLPVVGFIQARHLQEQFFPPADRDQFHIELNMPTQSSMEETRQVAEAIRQKALARDAVTNVHWFIGESAPSFYYNVIPKQKGVPFYAQALVQLKSAEGAREVIHELQEELDRDFPGARILVRQLEQGPPFDAPVEVRLFGPDTEKLKELSQQIREIMTSLPNVVHSKAELSETLPKVMLEVDEAETRIVNLTLTSIARQLNTTLEGSVGGSILEETEELRVRVRVGNNKRDTMADVVSTNLIPGQPKANANKHSGIPVTVIGKPKLVPEIAAIVHLDGRRMNEVQTYIKAGVLPATVLEAFKVKLEEAKPDGVKLDDDAFVLPPGYTLEYGGEAAERDDAVGNLMANVGVLMVLMVATLVLSFGSFRMAGLIGAVAMLSVGLGLGALWVFGYPFGFMAIIGTMGLVGVAINDAIVVLAAIREEPNAKVGDANAITEVVIKSTRHVVATSLTTMAGFAPLVIAGGGFWPPLAVAIAGGVAGATILALFFIPSAYILVMCRGRSTIDTEEVHQPKEQSISQTVPQPEVAHPKLSGVEVVSF